MIKVIRQVLDRLANLKGLPVLIGLIVVIISFVVNLAVNYAAISWLSFFTTGQWLLHVGVIIGLGGILFSDTL